MDIFAHTLWANALAQEANVVAKKKNKKFWISAGWTGFWGVFPDLFAFTVPFVLRFYFLIVGSVSFSDMWGRDAVDRASFQNGFDLAQTLYQYSHSLVIWAVVFAIVWAIYKRPRYELLGWALHILIDIPSHVLAFYPTPFLFPISDYRFPYGVQWSNYWYMIINYSLLLVVWARIFWRKYFSSKITAGKI